MKKNVCILMLLCITLLSACGIGGGENPGNTPEPTETAPLTATAEPVQTPSSVLPISETISLSFLSGVGAWYTDMELEGDGSFTGSFSDTNAGEAGQGYVATIYRCEFSGKMTDIKKIGDYAYSMTLSGYETTVKPDTEEIIDEVRYVYTTPYGIEGGKEFILYLPGMPVGDLPEEFVQWYPGDKANIATPEGTLNSFGLYNVEQEEGFYSRSTL